MQAQKSAAVVRWMQKVCKTEANTKLCPCLTLVCCTALVTQGLDTAGMFLEEALLAHCSDMLPWLSLQVDTAGTCCVQSVCKTEANTKPCPRLILVCCTALVTRGLDTEGLFLEEAPLDLVQFLMGSFQECKLLLIWL